MKNVIITVLSVLVFVLGGLLIFNINKEPNKELNDKELNDKESNDKETVNQEEQFDLEVANELVDKYAYISLATNIFENGLSDELMMIIALESIPNNKSFVSSCDSLYKNKEKASFVAGEYSVNLGEEQQGFCRTATKKIRYDSINEHYKFLFGETKEAPQKNVNLSPSIYEYDQNSNSFIELNCNCGGIDPSIHMYKVKNAKLNKDKLTIDVGYYLLKAYMNNDTSKYEYKSELNNKTYSNLEINEEGFKEQFISENLNKMDTYEFNFKKEKGHYILENVIKK